ncbi:MAG: HsdR family type I site-specific deoxyribonuclease [Nitrospira sp.]|nr:HsdR family type I site-specific deoxyribonuclease [Nitrospira sp.]
MTAFTESVVEDAALSWFEVLGYRVLHGPDIAAGEPAAERSDPNYRDVVLEGRLRQALVRLNPDLPSEALEDAFRKLTRMDASLLVERNRAVHRLLVDGITVEYRRKDLPAPRPGHFFVYAIRCTDESIYIGQTENLEQRWHQHLAGTAADHTRKHRPVHLEHYEEHASRKAAVEREKWLKTGYGRTWLKREIAAGRTRQAGGSIAGAQARVIDFDRPDNNDWLAVNQFTVSEGQHTRRPDVVLFVNGLPLAVIELKNPADEDATIWSAYQQLQTYQAQIPSFFSTNAALIISDGVQSRIGTLGAGKEWFKPWRTIAGGQDAAPTMSELQVVLEGVFEKRRFLDLVRHFIVFEDEGQGKLTKKMAGYHQFHAVNVAVEETLRAARHAAEHRAAEPLGQYQSGHQPGGEPGDRGVGVVWHTQGSGKSLTMAFYAGRVILHPTMANPTIVVLTDRNDLDDQLFGTFARCRDLLRQDPVQATDRADLRAKLSVASGGVVFTTIQKFMPPSAAPSPQPSPSGRGGSEAEGEGDWRMPVLSDRRNIVVIADEAYRSQYDFIDGFARHMRDALPNASFIGFTGTPIEKTDANTRAVFGDYISIYDIQRAVIDKATVPIYYESRLAKLELKASERPKIDPKFEEATEGEEVERKEKLKTKWAQLEAVVGSENRIKLIARDLVDHFEDRLGAMDGKAMVVCMSRRICVELYREIAALRPRWHADADDQGSMKVIMTGSASDPIEWQGHIRNKKRREDMALRFRAPKDPFRLVIVRDMWLTGFDAPSLHTMYIDKPMRGHGLMQTIARVNRVFKDKPGGLVVDYLGLADELKQALATYTESGGTGKTAIDQAEAVAVMLEKYEICRGLFGSYNTPAGLVRAFDWSLWMTGKPQERLLLRKSIF